MEKILECRCEENDLIQTLNDIPWKTPISHTTKRIKESTSIIHLLNNMPIPGSVSCYSISLIAATFLLIRSDNPIKLSIEQRKDGLISVYTKNIRQNRREQEFSL